MATEEQIKQKYLQFQLLQQQIQQITEHLDLLQQQNAEIDISLHAVQELEKVPLHNELLAPIADGVFIKAELKDNQKLIVNVGSNVTVEKTILEVIGLLENQKREIIEKMIEADALVQELTGQAMKAYKEVENYVQQTEG